MFYWKCLILFFMVILSGCSTPYLEQGFKSEADFLFAKQFKLTPAEVEFAKASKLSAWDVAGLRQHNITSKNAYDFIINEMRTSGFDKKFPKADIFDYLYWRPEAIRNNRTVLEQISYHNDMIKKEQEEKRNAELAQEVIKEKEELRKKNEKLKSDRAATEAEYIAVQRFGPICKNIKNISLSVAEWVGAKLSSNVSSVRFIRSEYSINTGDNFLGRKWYSSSCTVVVYADRGPLFCSVYETSVKNSIVMYLNNCSSSK